LESVEIQLTNQNHGTKSLNQLIKKHQIIENDFWYFMKGSKVCIPEFQTDGLYAHIGGKWAGQ